FDPKSSVGLAKKCPKLEQKRCAPVLGNDPGHRCALDPSLCYALPGGTTLRATTATLTRPDPCLKEYGDKSECPADLSVGVFVDLRAEGAAGYEPGPFIELYKPRRE